MLGTLDKDGLAKRTTMLDARQRALEGQQLALARGHDGIDVERVASEMPGVLDAIRAWVAEAEGDDLDLLLRALDVEVTVTRESVEVAGVVPMGQPEFVTTARTSASLFRSDQTQFAPFQLVVTLS